MRFFLLLLMSLCLGPILPDVAKADPLFSSPPEPGEIRQLFDHLSSDWTKTPDTVRLTVRTAQDQNFFHRPAGETSIAIQIGKWLHTPAPIEGETRLEKSRRLNRPSETSLAIGAALSHDEILEWFINSVPMGQGCKGIPAAAMAYFGRSVDDLRLEESAYLAVIIGRPERYHPHTSRDPATKRRNFLLLSMLAKDGLVPHDTAQQAANTPLIARNPLGTCK